MATEDAREEVAAAVDGDPTCSVCSADADFLILRDDRPSVFACWEHVSPVAADTDAAPGETDCPVAVPVSDRFR